MPDEPENLTLRVLQEMREEMRAMRTELRESVKDLTQRVDGLTVMVGMVIGMVKDHEERIEKLESR